MTFSNCLKREYAIIHRIEANENGLTFADPSPPPTALPLKDTTSYHVEDQMYAYRPIGKSLPGQEVLEKGAELILPPQYLWWPYLLSGLLLYWLHVCSEAS